MQTNNFSYDIKNDISNKYFSILQKAVKMSFSHYNNQEVMSALSVLVGSSLTIITLTNITVPRVENDLNLLQLLNIKGVTLRQTNATQTTITNVPLIDLEFVYNFLNNIDKSLDSFDKMLTMKNYVDNLFTQNNYHKNWV